MRRRFRHFPALLLGLFLLAMPTARATDRGALFRLMLDGHVMYLFGTLALELDPGQPRADLQDALRTYGMLAPGNPAYDGLPPQQKRRLDRLFQQGGLDATSMLSFKPVLPATMLALAEYRRQGYRSDLSSDAWLAREARRRHVRVLALESLGSQLALLDPVPAPDRWRRSA